MAQDVFDVMKYGETLLKEMLDEVVEDRIYKVYDPIKYVRQYKLKNAVSSETGMYKDSSTTYISTRSYIDERKMQYKNGATKVPRRIDEDRVKRRGDRWTSSIKTSHFSTIAYMRMVTISSKLERMLERKGYERELRQKITSKYR